MAIEQRLPVVNSDDGVWGDDLNAFLSKEHYNADATLTPGTSTNGGHKTVTIQAGTGTAAPLTFTSSAGTLLSTAAPGAVEFSTNKLYYTTTTPTRMTVAAFPAGTTVAGGDLHYADGTGTLVTLPIGGTNAVLTVIGGLPSWVIPAGSTYNYGLTGAIAAGIVNY
ncbi:MAG: hypothetical protein JWN26_228 [Candidatus Saccharibacteria bacterium]|nr:hypothetical protein [Candidatus Saccharibacteria bacterium]